MQQLCGYETVIRGYSPFCHLFTAEEWISFEYYFDIKYHYEFGYGNELSPYLGIHWLKSMTDILNKPKSSDRNLYISVVHREMMSVILVSLGLLNQTEYIKGNNIKAIFPVNELNANKMFSCSSIDSNGSFVRILLNSLPKPLSRCLQGPDGSCPLQLFINYIHQRYLTYKNFSKACQIDQNDTSDHLTFFQNDYS